jgi:hypothetical protein
MIARLEIRGEGWANAWMVDSDTFDVVEHMKDIAGVLEEHAPVEGRAVGDVFTFEATIVAL